MSDAGYGLPSLSTVRVKVTASPGASWLLLAAAVSVGPTPHTLMARSTPTVATWTPVMRGLPYQSWSAWGASAGSCEGKSAGSTCH